AKEPADRDDDQRDRCGDEDGRQVHGGSVREPGGQGLGARAWGQSSAGKVPPMGLLLAALALVILAVILGIAVIGLVVKLVWWLIVGVLIGALARLILPGSQPIGVLATALFG